MRLLRVLTTATALAALFARPSAAQEGRPFKDAWFWGLKGGGITYSDATNPPTTRTSPLIGADWLITRTMGGLLVSFDQTMMTANGQFVDRDATNTAFYQPVTVQNMRRFSIAGMLFPAQSPRLHPYIGAGFAFEQLSSAELANGAGSTTRPQIAADSIQTKRSTFTPMLVLGAQARLKPISVFAQTTVSPIQHNFFLSNDADGRAFNLSLEFGVRYNGGSSIEGIQH